MRVQTRYDVDGRTWHRRRHGRWHPAICGGGGGGTTKVTSTTNIPPKTAEELEMIRKQNQLIDIQIEQLGRQNALLAETFPAQKALFEAQTQAATTFARMQQLSLEALPGQLELQKKLQEQALEALTPSPEEEEITKLSNARTIAFLRGESPPLSPGQEEKIRTIFGHAEEEGERDIRRFGEELAASRGMRLTDTPVGRDLLDVRQNLASDLKSARAGAELNMGQAEQVFSESIRQFQAGLKQQAYNNRLSLLGRTQSQLPFPGQQPAFSNGGNLATVEAMNPLIGMMQQERFAGASHQQRGSFQSIPGVMDYIKVAAQVAQAAATAYAASSARFKKDIEPLDRDEYDRARRRLIRETPITRWRYKWEGNDRAPHTGPILEMAPEEIRESDTHLNLLNYTGTLHAAVKAIDRDVQELQTALKRSREAVAA